MKTNRDSRFPALGIGYIFSRACYGYMFSRACYGYIFSRALHWLHVFSRLALVACFLALGTGYMFSRACHWLHVSPHFALATCLQFAPVVCFLLRVLIVLSRLFNFSPIMFVLSVNRQCSECDPSDDDDEMEVDPEDTTPISQGRQRRVIKEPTKFTPDKGEVS